jgi:chromosome segregation ATPase
MEEIVARLENKQERNTEKISTIQIEQAALRVQVDQLKSGIAAAESRLQNIIATYGAYKRELEIVQENIKFIMTKLDAIEADLKGDISSMKVDLSLAQNTNKHTVKLWWVIISSVLSSIIGAFAGRMF